MLPHMGMIGREGMICTANSGFFVLLKVVVYEAED